MKTLRERLEDLVRVAECVDGEDPSINRPHYKVQIGGYVSLPFASRGTVAMGARDIVDEIEKILHEYLKVAHGDPPVVDPEGWLEHFAEERCHEKECAEKLIQMIRWQQAVIHTLAKDNGYSEGYEQGRKDEAEKEKKVMENMVRETAKAIRIMIM